MRYAVYLEQDITDISDAIKAKTGSTKTYKVYEMPAAIRSIPQTVNSFTEETVTVDSALSSSSENPVQNKVVNTAIENLNTSIGNKATKPIVTDNDNYTAGTTALTTGQLVLIYES